MKREPPRKPSSLYTDYYYTYNKDSRARVSQFFTLIYKSDIAMSLFLYIFRHLSRSFSIVSRPRNEKCSLSPFNIWKNILLRKSFLQTTRILVVRVERQDDAQLKVDRHTHALDYTQFRMVTYTF